jgi:hypothetical protein
MGNAAVTSSTITVKIPTDNPKDAKDVKVDVVENPIVDNYEPAKVDIQAEVIPAQAMPNADSKPDNSKKEDIKPAVPLASEGRSWWWSRRAAPKVEKVAEAKVEEPKVEKVEEPKTEEVKVETPKTEVKIPDETPKTEVKIPDETPKTEVETPKTEEPKVEEVKVETPKTEVKIPDETPKTEEPKTEVKIPDETPKTEVKIPDETPTAGLPNDHVTPNLTTPNDQAVKQARTWWSFMRRTVPKPSSKPAEPPVDAKVPAPEANTKNVTKVCARCQKPFEVPVSNAANNLCGRAECFNDPSARRACVYCNTEFVVVGARDYRRHCGASRCADAHAKRYVYQPTSKYSVKAIAWLNSVSAREGIHIHHAQNGGELRIPYMEGNVKRYFLADGFCEETNTVYEFYGDFWHGNPAKYNPDAVNVQAKKTFGQLYADTVRRQEIMARGHNMVTIWESEYDTQYLDSLIPIEK